MTKLNEASKFFIDAHRDSPVEELVAHTGCTAKVIKDYLKKPKQKAAKATPIQTTNGATVMTEQASHYDDEAVKEQSNNGAAQWMERYKKNITRI